MWFHLRPEIEIIRGRGDKKIIPNYFPPAIPALRAGGRRGGKIPVTWALQITRNPHNQTRIKYRLPRWRQGAQKKSDLWAATESDLDFKKN